MIEQAATRSVTELLHLADWGVLPGVKTVDPDVAAEVTEPGDFEARDFQDLIAEAFAPDYAPDPVAGAEWMFDATFSNDQFVFVSRIGGVPVGLILVSDHDDIWSTPTILYLYIRPGARGAQRQLIRALMRWSDDRDVDLLRANTQFDRDDDWYIDGLRRSGFDDWSGRRAGSVIEWRRGE